VSDIRETKYSLNEYLVDAIVKDDVNTVNALLDSGADPNGVIDSDEFTPLCFAATRNSLNSACLLLSRGANPNFFSKGLEATPIQYAKLNGYKEMYKLLSKHHQVQKNMQY
jgi:ankyrin repeat protein